jgi:oligopeptide transport system substrate-binding protein
VSGLKARLAPARGLIAAVVAVAFAAVTGCRRDPAPLAPPGVLRLAGDNEVPTLDPALGYDTSSWLFELLLFDPPLDYDDELDLVPRLASGYEFSSDSRRIVLRLRPDTRFSNGRAVVADDVRFAIERVLRPATHSPGAEFYRGIHGATDFIAGRAPHVSGIESEAGDRLAITLDEPDPLFPHKLAMPFAAPVPREEVERLGEDFAREPTGSGPFKLVEWRPGERLRLERVVPPAAGAGEGAAEGSPVRVIERLSGVSPQLAWLKFEAGELDLSDIPAAEFSRVLKDPAYAGRIVHRTTLTTQYVGLNCEVAPLDRMEVRQAFSAAIDRAKSLAIANGRGEVASGILPPGMPSFQPRTAPAPDPEKGRALLASAGLARGFTTTIWTRNDPATVREAEGLAQDLARIGVELKIKPVTWAALLEATRTRGMVPVVRFGWEADFPDPSNFLEVLFHSSARGANNSSFFASADVDRALDLAAPMPQGPARFAAYGRIESAILAAAPWVPLYNPATYVALSARVHGLRLHPLRPERLGTVTLD